MLVRGYAQRRLVQRPRHPTGTAPRGKMQRVSDGIMIGRVSSWTLRPNNRAGYIKIGISSGYKVTRYACGAGK